nr:uncharacterized protein LOC111508820 isoform X1 [Leptinotarsa decemlineata]
MQTSINFIVLCVFFSSVFCANGYYWRDWNGTVPSDAYVVVNDSRGPVYFAQAYVYNIGLFVGNIEKNQHSITVNPSTDIRLVKSSNVLKIFCSSSEDSLMWIQSHSGLISKLTKFVQPVLGGITNNNGTVYVGRYLLNGRMYVGSIHSDYFLYYTRSSIQGGLVSHYEILIQESEMNSNCDEKDVPPV